MLAGAQLIDSGVLAGAQLIDSGVLAGAQIIDSRVLARAQIVDAGGGCRGSDHRYKDNFCAFGEVKESIARESPKVGRPLL